MCVDYLSISQYNQLLFFEILAQRYEINLIRTNTIKEKF